MSPLSSILTLSRLFSSDEVVTRSDEGSVSDDAAGVTWKTLYPSDGTDPMNTTRASVPLTLTSSEGTGSPAASVTVTAEAGAGSLTVASMASFRSIDTGL